MIALNESDIDNAYNYYFKYFYEESDDAVAAAIWFMTGDIQYLLEQNFPDATAPPSGYRWATYGQMPYLFVDLTRQQIISLGNLADLNITMDLAGAAEQGQLSWWGERKNEPGFIGPLAKLATECPGIPPGYDAIHPKNVSESPDFLGSVWYDYKGIGVKWDYDSHGILFPEINCKYNCPSTQEVNRWACETWGKMCVTPVNVMTSFPIMIPNMGTDYYAVNPYSPTMMHYAIATIAELLFLAAPGPEDALLAVNLGRKLPGWTGKIGEKALEILGGQGQKSFYTSSGRKRVVDRLVNFNGQLIAHESKVGKTNLTQAVRDQLGKDADLLREAECLRQNVGLRHEFNLSGSPSAG